MLRVTFLQRTVCLLLAAVMGLAGSPAFAAAQCEGATAHAEASCTNCCDRIESDTPSCCRPAEDAAASVPLVGMTCRCQASDPLPLPARGDRKPQGETWQAGTAAASVTAARPEADRPLLSRGGSPVAAHVSLQIRHCCWLT